MIGWKRGLPPGKVSPEMVAKYEVYFSPGGQKWYRERQSNEAPASVRRAAA